MSAGRRTAAEAWAEALLSSDVDEDTWARFADESEATRVAVVEQLKAAFDVAIRRGADAVAAALEILERAARGLAGPVPLVLRARAVAAYLAGDWDTSIDAYREAEAAYRRLGDELDAARVLRSLVDVYQMASRPELALGCGEEALAVFERHGEQVETARLRNNLGNVFVKLDEYPRARAEYEQAITIYEAAGEDERAASARFNRALVELHATRIDDAERTWEEVREQARALGAERIEAQCEYMLAWVKARRGRFDESIDELERARETFARVWPPGVPLCDLDLAEVYVRLEAFRDARECARRAAERFEELGMSYELARAEGLKGIARARLGDASAVDDWARAARRFERIGNVAQAAWMRIQQAQLEIERGRPEVAISMLERARAEVEERGLRLLHDMAVVGIAHARLARRRPDEALATLALLDVDRRPDSLFDGLVRTEALRVRANALRARGDTAAAVAALEEAVQCVEESYAHVPGGDLRVAFFRGQAATFVDLAVDLAEVGEPERALVVLENGRSRSLRESVTRAPPRGVDDEREWRQARERLDWLLARRLDRELGIEGHELRRLSEQQCVDQEVEIRRIERRLAELARGRCQAARWRPIDLADLRGAASSGDVVLEYVVSGRGLRVLVAIDETVVDVALAADERSTRELRDRLFLHLEKVRWGREYVTARAEALRAPVASVLAELGRVLVEPVLDRVPAARGRPWVVVPFGALHDLPFHAFVVDGEPLIASCDVSYALSLWQLRRPDETVSDDPGPLHVVRPANAQLPEIEHELDGLARRYGSRLAPVPADTLVEWLAERPRGGALHVAGHGHFEAQHPTFSAVCLGDSFLLAHDVRGMRLGFSLVTLSGCETSRKRRIDGEELLGLPRALLGSGVRSVLGSQWVVDDRDARRFMDLFYDALARGASVRAATSRAQRGLMTHTPHPFSWAAFSLLGDPGVKFPSPETPDDPCEDPGPSAVLRPPDRRESSDCRSVGPRPSRR